MVQGQCVLMRMHSEYRSQLIHPGVYQICFLLVTWK
uniref:Uncharacterized protein n=1 Tax=Rhizophora mucronata TaxID=61149 RepID=A0A2P2NRU9_RHIMU